MVVSIQSFFKSLEWLISFRSSVIIPIAVEEDASGAKIPRVNVCINGKDNAADPMASVILYIRGYLQ